MRETFESFAHPSKNPESRKRKEGKKKSETPCTTLGASVLSLPISFSNFFSFLFSHCPDEMGDLQHPDSARMELLGIQREKNEVTISLRSFFSFREGSGVPALWRESALAPGRFLEGLRRVRKKPPTKNTALTKVLINWTCTRCSVCTVVYVYPYIFTRQDTKRIEFGLTIHCPQTAKQLRWPRRGRGGVGEGVVGGYRAGNPSHPKGSGAE